MDASRRKSLREPDEKVEFPGIVEEIVEIGGYTVGRTVSQPGWRWSQDARSLVGGQWCQAHHVGLVLSGRWSAQLRDGTLFEWGPDDVYDCPPGHDGYTVGDEPCVLIEWSGLRAFAGPQDRLGDRVLVALLFTDIVDSTSAAVRLGDAAWHDLLAAHYHMASAHIERFGGRIVETTGDGLLATFDSPARALRCAAAIRADAREQGVEIRAGVHVGEVAMVAGAIRGVAIHEAARIMSAADVGEILVSEITRGLASAAGSRFEDRGPYDLKGLPEPLILAAYVGEG